MYGQLGKLTDFNRHYGKTASTITSECIYQFNFIAVETQTIVYNKKQLHVLKS